MFARSGKFPEIVIAAARVIPSERPWLYFYCNIRPEARSRQGRSSFDGQKRPRQESWRAPVLSTRKKSVSWTNAAAYSLFKVHIMIGRASCVENLLKHGAYYMFKDDDKQEEFADHDIGMPVHLKKTQGLLRVCVCVFSRSNPGEVVDPHDRRCRSTERGIAFRSSQVRHRKFVHQFFFRFTVHHDVVVLLTPMPDVFCSERRRRRGLRQSELLEQPRPREVIFLVSGFVQGSVHLHNDVRREVRISKTGQLCFCSFFCFNAEDFFDDLRDLCPRFVPLLAIAYSNAAIRSHAFTRTYEDCALFFVGRLSEQSLYL